MNTPRTDAVVNAVIDSVDANYVALQIHAETLERELNDAHVIIAAQNTNLLSADAKLHAAAQEIERLKERDVKLLSFAGIVLKNHRSDYGVGDVDGGTLEEAAEKCGLIEYKEVKEPCCEGCECATMVSFPTHCYFETELGKLAKSTPSPLNEGESK